MLKHPLSSVIKSSFSSHMTFVYTLVVFVPVILFFITGLAVYTNLSRRDLFDTTTDALAVDVRHISDTYDRMQLPSLVIRQNDGLMLFLTLAESRTTDEIIDTTLDEVSVIEQILSVTQLYAIRIFCNSSVVPERWPIFLSSSRTELTSLSEWEYNYSASYMGINDGLKYPSVCMTQKLSRSGRDIGYLQIAVQMTEFFSFLYERSDSAQRSFVFNVADKKFEQVTDEKIDEVQGTLSARDCERLYSLWQKNGAKSQKPVSVKFGNERSLVCWDTVPYMDLVTFRVHSLKKTFVLLAAVTVSAILVLILSAFIFFLLIRYITLRMTNGVYSILDGMKSVQSGNMDVSITVDAQGEVGEAQQAFNDMTLKLKNQMNLIKQEQQLIADTEMKAMQNQINAHFLYNVLETIRMQAVIADQEQIAESIMTLGKMMRYCLRWRILEVTIAQEVEYIQSYVYILNIRNDYTIELDVSIPSELMNRVIPKMLLQPVVENSFIHGIEPLAQDAVIQLYTEEDTENGKLWLCVKDSGEGMDEQTLERLRAYLSNRQYEREGEGSIGVKNIQQRLYMFYGETYTVYIQSKEHEGTLVKIPVPLEV